MGFTTQSTTRPASTSTSTYYRASFDSIHTVNGSSGPPPSTRSSMAPRSFRLGGSSISSSSSSSSVYPPARQTPPPSTGSFSATRNPVFDSASTRPVAPSYPSVSAASNSATFSQDGSSLYPGSKKRTRVMTTDHQVARLNEVLAQTMFPTV